MLSFQKILLIILFLNSTKNGKHTTIEHIVKRTFFSNSVPRGIDKALLFTIEFIANNITQIRIIDPANTNNIISDCLTYSEKENLQNFCFDMLTQINKDKRNIIDYFEY